MRTRPPMILRCLTALLVFSFSLRAQQPTGSITGIVRDATDAVLPGASISLTRHEAGTALQQTTSEAGVYAFGSLLPGTYRVKFEASGFKTAVLDLLVEVGRVTGGDVSLEVGSSAETVNVEAHAVSGSPTRTGLEGLVTENLIRDLPLNGRSFLDLGQLEPGVQIQDGVNFDPTKAQVTALSLGGQNGRTTRITVDGLDISDERVGTTAQNVSPDSIQEYQISRSNLDISTGLSASGAVNIITRNGSNDLHGSGFFFTRTDDLAARVGLGPTLLCLEMHRKSMLHSIRKIRPCVETICSVIRSPAPPSGMDRDFNRRYRHLDSRTAALRTPVLTGTWAIAGGFSRPQS